MPTIIYIPLGGGLDWSEVGALATLGATLAAMASVWLTIQQARWSRSCTLYETHISGPIRQELERFAPLAEEILSGACETIARAHTANTGSKDLDVLVGIEIDSFNNAWRLHNRRLVAIAHSWPSQELQANILQPAKSLQDEVVLALSHGPKHLPDDGCGTTIDHYRSTLGRVMIDHEPEFSVLGD